MKKLLTIAIVLNIIACSTDNTENTSNPTVETKKSIFNPDPIPEDYRIAKNLNFIKDEKALSHFASVMETTTAAWVNTFVPDPNFRTALINSGIGQEDANPGDRYINIDTSHYGLDLSGANISDLTGIEVFKSLAQLNVSYNNLTILNISALTNLRRLECQNNQLTTLNLTANTKLYQIWCQNNVLTSLIIPSAVNTLWGVWCYGNRLTNLNLNGNINITNLFIQRNQLTSFDFTTFTQLKQINCSSNQWETLNFNNNPKLESLWCFSNDLLTDLSIKNNNNPAIVHQDFSSNRSAPKIYVDASFLPIANTAWPIKGSSTYQL